MVREKGAEMSVEKVDTLVVGGGQAGVAMSEHLSECGVPHLVIERARIAERWRSERWDSLVANGPAWHDRFPGMEFSDADPDAFIAKGLDEPESGIFWFWTSATPSATCAPKGAIRSACAPFGFNAVVIDGISRFQA